MCGLATHVICTFRTNTFRHWSVEAILSISWVFWIYWFGLLYSLHSIISTFLQFLQLTAEVSNVYRLTHLAQAAKHILVFGIASKTILSLLLNLKATSCLEQPLKRFYLNSRLLGIMLINFLNKNFNQYFLNHTNHYWCRYWMSAR